MCVSHTLSLLFYVVVNFIQQLVRLTQKSNCLFKNMVDKKACVSQQWGGNTINSGLYLKKERLALSFKYSVSISQPFKPSNKSFKYCTIISNVQ